MRTDSALFAQKNVELAKDPRYVIELAFDTANTQLWYFTSHSDTALPPTGVSGSILGIVEGLSGTSQTLNPDTANASIGNINFSLVDRLSIVTTTLGGQLVLGRSTRKQRARVYVGFQGLAWPDYTLVQTQLVTEIAFSDGAYKFTCADIQREMRKDLFVLAKTTLALSVLAADTTINVVSTTGFSLVAHGTSYSDAPSATVAYVRIQDEIIRYTGTTATSFTGCARGALNTRAVDHLIDATLTEDRRTAVTEYVYLELPAIDLMYRLLTGKDRLGASVMPSTWNLGIATSYVRLADFTGIGKDLWDTADDQQGFIVRLEDLEKTDGKKFIETELALLCGVFQPIYADGASGCKRMANILAGAAYTGMLDKTNLVSWGDLVHDFGSMHNVFEISWNWEPLQKAFTRVNVLVDAASIATHGRADPLKLKFRGLHGSRHSSAILAQRFDALRDRFTGPPLRLDASALPSLNTAEVGDVKRVRVQNVRDFTAPGGGGPLDRSFEIQNIQIDWITGALKKKLFGSSQAPGALAPTSDATVLTTSWYTGAGTDLATVLTITGSNPGHVSASGSLAGNVDMNAAGAIYYYNDDLQIDAGVEVTIANNVQLRVKGFLQNNGKINGKGKGLAGAAALASPPVTPYDFNPGTRGFLGNTSSMGGLIQGFGAPGVDGPGVVISTPGDTIVGIAQTVPSFNISWNGASLLSLPSDLRGSSGSTGLPSYRTGAVVALPKGGAGGNGGAGFLVVCRGLAMGVAGIIDLSGSDGALGEQLNGDSGSGAGGAPGALLILLDGAAATATGLTDSGFVASQGRTPARAGSARLERVRSILGVQGFTQDLSGFLSYRSYFIGSGDGDGSQGGVAGFPLPNLSDSRGGSRVQYVPGLQAPVRDPPPLPFIDIEELIASNWTEQSNPKSFTLLDVTFGASLYVAVGISDGGDAYIVTSPNGITWTERANPKAFQLNHIVWNGSIFVAVGNSDGGDSYLITSTNGTTWTERANPKTNGLFGIAWNGSNFVAVGVTDATDAYIITSPDGTTWTERANPKASSLLAVTWNGSIFVAVGEPDATDAYIVTSPDGTTWTERAPAVAVPSGSLVTICWSKDRQRFIAGGAKSGPAAYELVSADGIVWAEISLTGIVSSIDYLIWSGRLFVMLSAQKVLVSNDGTNWRQTVQLDFTVRAVVRSSQRFVAVGDGTGPDAFIVASLTKLAT